MYRDVGLSVVSQGPGQTYPVNASLNLLQPPPLSAFQVVLNFPSATLMLYCSPPPEIKSQQGKIYESKYIDFAHVANAG